MIRSLCDACRHLREVITPKGSRFLLCQLSATNPDYRKYPPQPIVACAGFEQRKGVGEERPDAE